MKHHIYTQIEIQADSTTVWNILADFSNYPNWNPFITTIQGKLKMGERLRIAIGTFKFEPTIKELEEGRKLSWLGRLLFPGLFDGRHTFECLPQSDGTTLFIHQERFSGLLVPFMKKKLDTETKLGFESMNSALKELAEQH